jgi:hypothetical protein
VHDAKPLKEPKAAQRNADKADDEENRLHGLPPFGRINGNVKDGALIPVGSRFVGGSAEGRNPPSSRRWNGGLRFRTAD